MEEKLTLWAARDRDGLLYAYEQHPFPMEAMRGYWDSTKPYYELPQTMLPELKWEDEPRLVELTVKYK